MRQPSGRELCLLLGTQLEQLGRKVQEHRNSQAAATPHASETKGPAEKQTPTPSPETPIPFSTFLEQSRAKLAAMRSARAPKPEAQGGATTETPGPTPRVTIKFDPKAARERAKESEATQQRPKPHRRKRVKLDDAFSTTATTPERLATAQPTSAQAQTRSPSPTPPAPPAAGPSPDPTEPPVPNVAEATTVAQPTRPARTEAPSPEQLSPAEARVEATTPVQASTEIEATVESLPPIVHSPATVAATQVHTETSPRAKSNADLTEEDTAAQRAFGRIERMLSERLDRIELSIDELRADLRKLRDQLAREPTQGGDHGSEPQVEMADREHVESEHLDQSIPREVQEQFAGELTQGEITVHEHVESEHPDQSIPREDEVHVERGSGELGVLLRLPPPKALLDRLGAIEERVQRFEQLLDDEIGTHLRLVVRAEPESESARAPPEGS